MLQQVIARKQALNLSMRSLAKQLEVSPALLSPVLSGKRQPSSKLNQKFKRWLNTAVVNGGQNHPNSIYQSFMAERCSFVSPGTMRYYREKLEPFILWCEQQHLGDIPGINRTDISSFLAYIRQGRRSNRIPLSNGAIKLHHQTLKTLFNYTAETLAMPERVPFCAPLSMVQTV